MLPSIPVDEMDFLPQTTYQDILDFQFSSWYPQFKHISIKSKVIKPLNGDFKTYLLADGVQIPLGSDDNPSDNDSDTDPDDEEDEEEEHKFAFPDLDIQIRQAISEYGAVFPKLNFSSPKDASWILPSSSPLKCTSPSEVYMLLKSSDFTSHDLTTEHVFEGCKPEENLPNYQLELILRKWYHVDPSREFRCFVRSRKLIGISQRDLNFYLYMNDPEIQSTIIATITHIWEKEISQTWKTENYTFDLILTRDLTSAHIIDFNPFIGKTDPLLFTYEELFTISKRGDTEPILKTIDSAAHWSLAQQAPKNQHNMVPLEMLTLSEGRTIADFTEKLHEEIRRSVNDD